MTRITRTELLRILSIDEEFLLLMEREYIVCPDPQDTFASEEIDRLRVCWTLHAELGVNVAGIEVALNLLDRLEEERRRAHDRLRGRDA